MSAVFAPSGPGIYPGISYEHYASVDRTRISNLKEMARSALHYQYRLGNPRESATLSLGRSAHAAVLEPKRFETDFVLWDERTESGTVRPRRGKDWDAFCAANSGKTIIKADEHAYARAIRDAIYAKPVAQKYLRQGQAEVSLIWEDVETKRRCKGRVDWITHVDGIDCLVGLKTARSTDPREFANQAAKLLYHLQFAFYYDGYATITGKEARVVELVVESSPPYDVVAYIVPSEVLELGREEYRRLLERLGDCELLHAWPGRAENEVMFNLPAYLTQDEDNDVDALDLEA